jgi:uncharacterized cupin superfamily protein
MSAKIPKFAIATQSPTRTGSRYPSPYNELCMNRTKHILGNQFDLDQFGVNLAILEPGAWSSQRHWHENEDEFIYVLEGVATLADDSGEHELVTGMCAGFKAGNGNGHCLKNLTDKRVVYLEVGTRSLNERAHYSDIDMMVTITDEAQKYTKKDGSDF